MKCSDFVVIKSFPNGIALHLNTEVEFSQILDELEMKFAGARNFFGDVPMALSIEGRKVTDAEELLILEAIKNNCDLKIACIVEKEEEKNESYVKALSHTSQMLQGSEDGYFFRGNLKNKEVLEIENSIIVMGDVYPGCAVISSKNIIILGGLYGEAYAGGNGTEKSFIAALEMEPERLKIGDFKYKPSTKASRWGIHNKIQPKIAYVKNDKITFELLTKELLSTF